MLGKTSVCGPVVGLERRTAGLPMLPTNRGSLVASLPHLRLGVPLPGREPDSPATYVLADAGAIGGIARFAAVGELRPLACISRRVRCELVLALLRSATGVPQYVEVQ